MAGVVCACCGAGAGAPRSLRAQYWRVGCIEVYADMLRDTFNLTMPPPDALAGDESICEPCVARLRDASAFRLLVLQTQRRLRRSPESVKAESDGDGHPYESEPATLDDGLDDDDKHTLKIKKEPTKQWSSDDDDALTSVARRHRGGTARATKAKATKAISVREKSSGLKRVQGLNTAVLKARLQTGVKITKKLKTLQLPVRLTKKQIYIANSWTILTYSNVTPFRGKNSLGFRCFYCPKSYEDPQLLRQHTAHEHTDEKQNDVFATFTPDNHIVYVDITDLTCRVCLQKMPDLAVLKTHLATIHKMKFHAQRDERDIPFILNVGTLQCQKCAQNFETFGAIERHMNMHYRNYICKVCETGYVTNRRLSAHKNIHITGSFPCFCGKSFATQDKLKKHSETSHNSKARFSCPHCRERFTDYYKRQRHLVSVHNAKPLAYKCNVCEKIFEKRISLNNHTKKYHLQERNHMCDQCTYKCFTNHELQMHMIKHNGQREHECAVCKKSYARKKTLKEHMRIHNNDRRFACSACGLAFVQKCSLKGHMKTHHPNLMKFEDR